MPSNTDLRRSWLLRKLGLVSSNLSLSDLEAQLYKANDAFLPQTVDPKFFNNFSTLNASQAVFLRVVNSGTISKIAIFVGTASGNISLGVYDNTGSGANSRPNNLLSGTGSIICPATGRQEISLSSPVTVEEGMWFALVADNALATFGRGNTAGTTFDSPGFSHFKNTVFPLPSPAGEVLSGATWSIIMLGVE